MQRYRCEICGFIYDEAAGWPEDQLPPGTHWDAVPDAWRCPECGVGKAEFVLEST